MSAPFVGAIEHQCQGKRTYLNSKTAKQAAKRAMTTHGGGKVSSYKCPHCGRWHNGHAPYSLAKKRR